MNKLLTAALAAGTAIAADAREGCGQGFHRALPSWCALAAGAEQMRVEFGMMHMLGVAPDLDAALADPADRDAARNFMELSEVD